MDAGDFELALLVQCCVLAALPAQDQREAHILRLAAIAVRGRFPGESVCLMRASENYFAAHPLERLPPAEVARRGWVPSLPRLREMLSECFSSP